MSPSSARMIIPKGRTTKYAIWRGCERVGIIPPDCERTWDDCSVWAQANIVAYDQIREHEDIELLKAQMKNAG